MRLVERPACLECLSSVDLLETPCPDVQEQGWILEVPDTDVEPSPFDFSTARVSKPYHQTVGLDGPLAPLSSTSPSGTKPDFTPEHFRAPSTPGSLKEHAKTRRPLVAVHVTLFSDAAAVGISVPHGVFDGTGLAKLLEFISAEMSGRIWQPPAVHGGENVVSDAIKRLKAKDLPVPTHPPLSPGWVPVSLLGVLSLLVNMLWEKLWHKNKMHYGFVNRQAVDRLVEKVKADVKEQTSGKEWISSGDAVFAWMIKNLHADETASPASFACSPVFNIRSLLIESSPDLAPSIDAYCGNAVNPYPFSPEPIRLSQLTFMSIASLALIHRRTINGCKTLPWLRARLLLSPEDRRVPPYMPERGFPGPTSSRTVYRWIASNHAGAFAHFHVPAAAAEVEGESVGEGNLPLIAFYRWVKAPIDLDGAVAIQTSEMGTFLVASTRRARWASLERAIERLERGEVD
ncbi:uncharacterized protein JCM10292_001406 [Rhodotorula paludigena]|uniref:uncharacterized protein n=1 Tax=Rhodotorula paludigena TaxID=86838 RepID=UPI003181A2FC